MRARIRQNLLVPRRAVLELLCKNKIRGADVLGVWWADERYVAKQILCFPVVKYFKNSSRSC
jgi:hypothetical protein